MLGLITFAPLYIAIGRCAIRCNTSSHPRVGLVVMFEKISSIKGLLVPGVLPLVPRAVPSGTGWIGVGLSDMAGLRRGEPPQHTRPPRPSRLRQRYPAIFD